MKVSEKQIIYMQELRNSGLSYNQIARWVGVHPVTVGRYLSPAYAKSRIKSLRKCEQADQDKSRSKLVINAAKFWLGGFSTAWIAKRLNVSEAEVYNNIDAIKFAAEMTSWSDAVDAWKDTA